MANEINHFDFLVKDYEMKVNFLKDHFSRALTRFNYFLGIELALFGFLGYLLFDPVAKNFEATLFPILIGIVLSIIWCFVGWQDRALVKMYQSGIKEASLKISATNGLGWYAGKEVGAKVETKGFFQYSKYFSITTIPFWLGLLSSITWVALLFMRSARSAPFHF